MPITCLKISTRYHALYQCCQPTRSFLVVFEYITLLSSHLYFSDLKPVPVETQFTWTQLSGLRVNTNCQFPWKGQTWYPLFVTHSQQKQPFWRKYFICTFAKGKFLLVIKPHGSFYPRAHWVEESDLLRTFTSCIDNLCVHIYNVLQNLLYLVAKYVMHWW